MELLEYDIYLGKTGLRTLFSIECRNGKSVIAHSYFKEHEKEVILAPGSYFEVISQFKPTVDFLIIHLKEIEPSVSLRLPFSTSSEILSGILEYSMKFYSNSSFQFIFL